MKKYMITLLIVLAFVTNPSSSKAAEAQWDGAQVVKGQTGKMTFTKDVKVYKKNANGTYSSMTVKRNNYFRVYDIEKYDNKTFYWMSSGYRVQATDLVVFKKVPLNVRASLYDNPGYININGQASNLNYGTHYLKGFEYGSPSYDIVIGENLYYDYTYPSEGNIRGGYIDATDIRIAETIKRDEGLYKLTADTRHLRGPMAGRNAGGKYSKGTVFQSLGIEINGYIRMQELGTWGEDFIFTYIPVTLLQPVQAQEKRYIRYGVVGKGKKSKELKRFDEVMLLTEKNMTAWIEIDGETYYVPKKVLATIKPNESPVITTSFLPNDTLQQLVYTNGVYKKTANNRFEAQSNNQFIDYLETEQTFSYEKDGIKYIFDKPVTEGSKVTRIENGMKNEGFVRAIHYTFTESSGTFNNVVETSYGEFFAPGYGYIKGYSSELRSYE
ncbi:hypothetical protein ABFY48_25475 [Lysinibacillus pakistanensis]|uniref:hypothetical protein n=1 Tax=Lysinibacillus pakistanensis TaxID=759811 RepID=UPI003D2A4236